MDQVLFVEELTDLLGNHRAIVVLVQVEDLPVIAHDARWSSMFGQAGTA